MGTVLLQLRTRVYGEPVVRADEWGGAAKKILQRSGWSDEDIAAIANNWHPGLMENGVPRWATLNAVRPPAGNAIRGHPALYLGWEQAGGKLGHEWQTLPGFEDISGKQAREHLGYKPTAFRDQWATRGLLTPPVKINGRNFWPDCEVQAVICGRVRGLDDHSIRLLVADLVAQRAAPAEAA